MTVYKVPEVNMLVKVEKKKISIMKMCYFLFVTFLSKLSGFHARKNLTYLNSGTLQCSIVKMYLFIFLVPGWRSERLIGTVT